MIVLQQVGTVAVLIVLALWLQCAGIALLVHWVRRTIPDTVHNFGPVRSAVLVVYFMAAIILINGLHVLLWASCYRALCLPSWNSAIYFSASSYPGVGAGDVTLPTAWRILGPVESILGIVMSGVSVGLLFAILAQLINRWERVSSN